MLDSSRCRRPLMGVLMEQASADLMDASGILEMKER